MAALDPELHQRTGERRLGGFKFFALQRARFEKPSVMTPTCVAEISAKPSPMARICFLPFWMILSSPAISSVTSASWPGRMPISPSTPGSSTVSTSPSNTLAVGVMISSLSVAMAVPDQERIVPMLPFM
jgi:hypothetical protein